MDLPKAYTHTITCLFCGKSLPDDQYTCSCRSEDWHTEYRSTEIRYPGNAYKDDIRRSYQAYDFDHPLGILQYKPLPFHSSHTEVKRVGMTPMFNPRQLSNALGVDLYLKSEGHNPSGCFKDRETLMCVQHAKLAGKKHAIIYSSGNAAASAAIFAREHHIQLMAVVAGDTYREKIECIASHGSDVVVVGGKNTEFEKGYRLFSAIGAEGFYKRHHIDNWSVINPYRIEGDKTTAIEMIKHLELRHGKPVVPDCVIVPTANGSGLAGLVKGFKELHLAGIIPSLPRVVSAGIAQASPVARALQNQNFDTPEVCSLANVDEADARIGSTILASEGYDSIEAAKAVRETGGIAVEVTRHDIEEAYGQLLTLESALVSHENVLPEPASLITVAAIAQVKQRLNLRRDALVVSILTGSGLKAAGKVRKLTPDDPSTMHMINAVLMRKEGASYPESRFPGREVHVSPDKAEILKVLKELK